MHYSWTQIDFCIGIYRALSKNSHPPPAPLALPPHWATLLFELLYFLSQNTEADKHDIKSTYQDYILSKSKLVMHVDLVECPSHTLFLRSLRQWHLLTDAVSDPFSLHLPHWQLVWACCPAQAWGAASSASIYRASVACTVSSVNHYPGITRMKSIARNKVLSLLTYSTGGSRRALLKAVFHLIKQL